MLTELAQARTLTFKRYPGCLALNVRALPQSGAISRWHRGLDTDVDRLRTRSPEPKPRRRDHQRKTQTACAPFQAASYGKRYPKNQRRKSTTPRLR